MLNKILLLVCFFCLKSSLIFSQIVLEISIKDCRLEHTIGWFKFKLYRKKVLVDSFETTSQNPKKLHLLRRGDYKIEYKTLFGKTESVFIKIKEKKKYNVDLCLEYMDYTKESYIPIISRLENGEQYKIYYSSQGAFFLNERTILIRRHNDKYFASIGEKEVELSPHQIDYIKHFELELKHMNIQGCINTDTYKLTYKNKVIKILDSSCRWSGGDFLIERLGWNTLPDGFKK